MTKLTIELTGYVQCRECDSAIAAQPGRLVHHDDGSHTWIAHDRRLLVVGYEFITAPLSAEASRAINDWICEHHAELDEVLKPHGVAAADILQPEYRRAVYRDEIRAALDR